jgi:hypothetical protein
LMLIKTLFQMKTLIASTLYWILEILINILTAL